MSSEFTYSSQAEPDVSQWQPRDPDGYDSSLLEQQAHGGSSDSELANFVGVLDDLMHSNELNATGQPQDLDMLATHDFEASHFSEILYGPEVVQTTEPAGFLLENILHSGDPNTAEQSLEDLGVPPTHGFGAGPSSEISYRSQVIHMTGMADFGLPDNLMYSNNLNAIEQSQDLNIPAARNFGAGPISDMSYGHKVRVQTTEAADFTDLLDDIMYSNDLNTTGQLQYCGMPVPRRADFAGPLNDHISNNELSTAEQPRSLGMPMPDHNRIPSSSHSNEPMSGPYIPPPTNLISAFSPVDTNPKNVVRKKEVVLGSRTAIYAIMDTCLKDTLLASVPGHRSFLNSIASLDGWIQLYKFAIMFTWFHQATIELAPNYDAVITNAISRFLAIQRQTNPTWALKEDKVMLWVSNTNAVEMDTQLTDSSDFRKKFNDMVTAFREYFLEHALRTAQLLVFDQPEWAPPWEGMLCCPDKNDRMPRPHAQALTQWDPRYGCPLLHEYVLESDATIRINWFKGSDIFNFIVHLIGRTDSPGCLIAQEYKEDNGVGVWRPIIPNNVFLATVISLAVLMFHKYLGRLNRINDRDSEFLSKSKARVSRLRGIRRDFLGFFESVDQFSIPSVSHEDCVKAKKGKDVMMKQLELEINILAGSNSSEL